MTILKMAWRNVWRNRVRSLVVIIAIALGLWAGLFASAIVKGMMDQKIDSVIRLEMSHFQIHHPKFQDEFLPGFTIPGGMLVQEQINTDTAVVGTSARAIASVMIGSAHNSGAILVSGVDPDEEAVVTQLDRRIVEGGYFDCSGRNPILVSTHTAANYNLRLRSKLVLTLQDVKGEITAGAFRVCGIFDSDNKMYDEMHAFVMRKDLQQLLDLEDGVHEIAVLLNAHNLADPRATFYQAKHPELEVKPWLDLSSGMRFMVEAFDTYLYMIVSIIMVALILSIINTMLMAILERTHEIGMLMAIGMNKPRVFGMIMLETIFLSTVGAPLGLLLAWSSITYFGKSGIDFAGAAYGDMGFSNVIHPSLELSGYIGVAMMVLAMSIIAAIYPAWKALKLNPVEAIRDL